MSSIQRCSSILKRPVFTARRFQQNPKFFATTTSIHEAHALSNDIENEMKRVKSHFPWRNRPEEVQMNIIERLRNEVCKYLLLEVFFNADSTVAPGATYFEVDFLLGAGTAFKTSMAAIFNHKRLLATAILHNKEKAHSDVKTDVKNDVKIDLKSDVKIDSIGNIESDKNSESASQESPIHTIEGQSKGLSEEDKNNLQDLKSGALFVPDLGRVYG
jgi:hypothetical protein